MIELEQALSTRTDRGMETPNGTKERSGNDAIKVTRTISSNEGTIAACALIVLITPKNFPLICPPRPVVQVLSKMGNINKAEINSKQLALARSVISSATISSSPTHRGPTTKRKGARATATRGCAGLRFTKFGRDVGRQERSAPGIPRAYPSLPASNYSSSPPAPRPLEETNAQRATQRAEQDSPFERQFIVPDARLVPNNQNVLEDQPSRTKPPFMIPQERSWESSSHTFFPCYCCFRFWTCQE